MLLLGNVKKLVLINSRSWALPFELKNHHTIVVTRGEQVDFGVSCDNPKTVVFSFKGLNSCALVQVPYTYSLIFSAREYKILMRVKEASGNVLEVASASINFPSFGLYVPY